MGKKGTIRKKRKTHVEPEIDSQKAPPKSFVFKRGKVGKSTKDLITDLRHVLQPNTAINLKERASNSLKDFINVAGPLGITHFLVFSSTELSSTLKISRIPHGPTLSFKMTEFSTRADIDNIQVKPHSTQGAEYKTSPLIVLNNFESENPEIKIAKKVLQNLVPKINIETTNIETWKRVILFDYNEETDSISMRHYFISVNQLGLSRNVKKVAQSKVQDLSKMKDISDYVLSGTFASESDLEDGPDSQINLFENPTQKNSIRLVELGPRIDLQLIKIESDAFTGEVLYHKFISKTEEEIEKLAKHKELKMQEKARIKKEQEEKKKLKNSSKFSKNLPNENDGKDLDDEEWYEKEVGEKAEPGMFSSHSNNKEDLEKKEKYNPFSYKKKRKLQQEKESNQKSSKRKNFDSKEKNFIPVTNRNNQNKRRGQPPSKRRKFN